MNGLALEFVKKINKIKDPTKRAVIFGTAITYIAKASKVSDHTKIFVAERIKKDVWENE